MKYFIYILFLVTVLSCDNLERKNPIDANQSDYILDRSIQNDTNTNSSTNNNNENNNNNNNTLTETTTNAPNILIKSVTIISEDYEDGVINAGETVKMVFTLENNGAEDALGVKVLFMCNSYYVNNFTPDTWIAYSSSNLYSEPNIYAQSDATSSGSMGEVEFDVSTNARAGSALEIELIIKDENDNTWKQSFKTTIQDPPPIIDVQFSKYYVSYEEFSDGVVSRGEDIRLRPFIINRGTIVIYQPKITITSSNPYVNILYSYSKKSLHQWDNSDGWLIYPGKEARPIFTSGDLRFNLSELAPSPCEVEFNVIIEDAVNRIFLDSFTVTIY